MDREQALTLVWGSSLGRIRRHHLHNLASDKNQCLVCGKRARREEKEREEHVFCGKECQKLLWALNQSFSLGLERGSLTLGEIRRTNMETRVPTQTLLDLLDLGIPLLGPDDPSVKTEFLFKKLVISRKCDFDIETNDISRAIMDRTAALLNRPLVLPRLVIKYRLLPQFSALEHFEFLALLPNGGVPLGKDLALLTLELTGIDVGIDGTAFIAFILLLQRDYEWNYFTPYMEVFLHAIKTQNLNLVARMVGTRWVYRNGHFLMCHLLHNPHSKIIFMTALSWLADYTMTLQVKSVQEYARVILKRISGEKTQPRVTLPGAKVNETRNIRLGLPPIDDTTWPVMIDNYTQDDSVGFVPYYDYLKEKKRLTLVARDDDGALAGYVTCHFERARHGVERLQPGFGWNPNLEIFEQKRKGDKLFQIFSIDGLHVSETWRGGRGESLASLLMYHALEMALAASNDLGVDRVACHSAARTTSLIMRQFGATFFRESELMEWIELRVAEKKSIKDDVEYYVETFPFTDRVDNERVQRGLQKSTEKAYERLLSIWGRKDYTFDRYLRNLKRHCGNVKKNDWDTFLTIAPSNKVFHRNMEKYRKLVADLGTVKRERPVEGMDVEEEEVQQKRKRTELSISFSVSSLDSFMPSFV